MKKGLLLLVRGCRSNLVLLLSSVEASGAVSFGTT